jgi:hypothetical protein
MSKMVSFLIHANVRDIARSHLHKWLLCTRAASTHADAPVLSLLLVNFAEVNFPVQ